MRDLVIVEGLEWCSVFIPSFSFQLSLLISCFSCCLLDENSTQQSVDHYVFVNALSLLVGVMVSTPEERWGVESEA